MRVAFDEQIFTLQYHGGISRVFTEIAGIYAAGGVPDVSISPIGAPVVNEHLLHDAQLATVMGVRKARSWQWALTRCLLRKRWRGQVDVLHSTFYLTSRLRDYPGARHVVTIHDMIPEIFPSTVMRLRRLTDKHRYAETADQIICVSQATKDDLQRIYPDIQTPISVVHSGVGAQFTVAAPEAKTPGHPSWLPEHYLLFVGKRSGYKDASTLIDAFRTLSAEHPTLVLLFAGGGALTRQETLRLEQLGIAHRVVQRTVEDGEMPNVYRNAKVFVFPSRYEGFGLPALEAMASGTPAVLCRASALPEVGGRAARYFDPGDHATLAQLLDSILTEGAIAAQMRRDGVDRAAEFTWQRTAQGVAAAYRQALAR
jgi:glycosyltransferase involved in cell wall biosynthesis